jgi:alpha-glucosidase
MAAVDAPATWVLSNHDVVRHTTRLADGDPERGLRRARAATLLMLGLPGSAYLYQGEELGLPEVTDLPDEVRQDPAFFRNAGQDGTRDGCRVPLPWTERGTSYGFGPDGGEAPWLPQPAGWAGLSVAAQQEDADSTLWFYRRAIALRREHPALGAGTGVEWLDAPAGVLAFRRDSDTGGDGSSTGGDGSGTGGSVVCTVNTTGAPVAIPLPGRPLLASVPLPAGFAEPYGAVAAPGAPATVPGETDQSGEPAGSVVELPADSAIWWAV